MPDLGMVVDVVDEANRVVGRAQRAQLFEKRLNFRTVDVLLFDSEGRLVLQKLPPQVAQYGAAAPRRGRNEVYHATNAEQHVARASPPE